MKYAAFLLLAGGIVFILTGAKERMEIERMEKKSLESALLLINEGKNGTGEKQTGSREGREVKTGDVIGMLTIPQLDAALPIIEGTQEDELKKGVGHVTESAMPGENDQIVLSGHRDTVFRKIGSLTIGDQFRVQMPKGEYVYEIAGTKIVEADDRTVIQSTFPYEELVLTTCYPFSYIGNAPERYIITAKRIP
jgi:sortase A